MQLRKNRKIERAAVNAARTFFEENDCVFQEIDLANDYGKDAYIDIVDGDIVTGTCVAAQIKGGDKYRRANGFAIPVDEDHFRTWKTSSLPIAGIVHDPKSEKLYWVSISGFLKNLTERPTSIPIPLSSELNVASLNERFKKQFESESGQLAADCVLNLSSDNYDIRMQAISDCFALGRSDPRVLIALRQFLQMLSGDAREYAIIVLTHLTPHPDIFWTSENWVPSEICKAACKHFRWTPDEISLLLNAAPWETWHRAGMGEHVYMMLDEDPDIFKKLPTVVRRALETNDDHVAYAAAYLLIYWSGESGPKTYQRIVKENPALEDLPMMAETEYLLKEHGYLLLFE